MASTYFVKGGGSNTAPYDTWAKAATSLATALAAATTTGDIIVIDKDDIPSGDQEVASDTTYTFAGNVSLISATDDDSGTAYTPAKMAEASWIGNSTTNRNIILAGGYAVYIYGVTLRISGGTQDNMVIGNTTGCDYTLEGVELWLGNTASCIIVFGAGTGGAEYHTSIIDCVFRVGAVGTGLQISGGNVYISGASISASGSTPTNLFLTTGIQGHCVIESSDLSNCGTLIANQTGGHHRFEISQSKLPSTVVAAQTTYANRSQVEAFCYDCSAGDNHYEFLYNNGIGELTVSTSIYVTADGASYNISGSKCSWKLVTTSSASFANPFITPWISVHHEGTSQITPYLEVMKDSAGNLDESELWSDWMYKGTSGSTQSTLDRTDRGTIKASTTDQASSSLGAGDWTGEGGSAVFHKLAPASAITPAEIGDLCARVCVGKASTTVYVDPQIRGRT